MDIANLFNVTWTPTNVSLVLVFAGVAFLGFYLIYKEIKIIKAKQLKKREYGFSFVFGLCFAASVMLGVLVAVQYGSQASWGTIIIPTNILLPRFTTILFMALYGILMAYPCIELVSFAMQVKTTTPFIHQAFFNKHIISRFQNVHVRIIVACLIYAGIFIVLPATIQAFTGLPFIITGLVIYQSFPVFLVGKLGSQGYFWGVNLHYYNIRDKKRFWYNIFHSKESRKRAMGSFNENPVAVIALPVMIYVYINTFVSIVQTSLLFFNDPATRVLNFTFLVSTTTNVITALVGYFNQYWKKQLKYKFSEVIFAAYLFAAISMNLFLNFLVKQPETLLNALSVTFVQEINENTYVPWIAVTMIQKITFAIYVTSYIIRKGGFKEKVLSAIMMVARNRLNPRPLINLLPHVNEGIKSDAKRKLEEMYRLHSTPYIAPPAVARGKNMLAKLVPKILNPRRRKQAPFEQMFDALGSDYIAIREGVFPFFTYMAQEDPQQFIDHFNKHIKEQNAMKDGLLMSLLDHVPQKVLEGLDLEFLIDKIERTGTQERARAIGALIKIEPLVKERKEALYKIRIVVVDGIFSTSKEIQIKAMEYLRQSTSNEDIDDKVIEEITRKTNNADGDIAEMAILCLNRLQGTSTDPGRIERTIKMLSEPDRKLQKTALKSAISIVDKAEINIPATTIESLLKTDDMEITSLASTLAGIVIAQHPERYRPSLIEPILLSGNLDAVKHLLASIRDVIATYPREFLPVLSAALGRNDIEVNDLVKPHVVSIGSREEYFSSVLDIVLNIKEDSRFTVRNFAREILVDIGKNVPEKMIPLIESTLVGEKDRKRIGGAIPFLEDRLKTRIDNENFRVNAAAVIGDLGEIRPDLVDVELLLVNATNEKNWRIRRDLVTSLGKLAPVKQGFPLDKYFALSDDENANVRVALVRGIMRIVKEKHDAVDEQFMKKILLDENDDVREHAIKIVAMLGGKRPNIVIPLLVQGLHDAKWSVKNAAAEALGTLSREAPESIPADILCDIMLNDKDKWTKWQAEQSLCELCKAKPGAIKINDIAKMNLSDDENLTVAFLALLRYVEPNPIDTFFKVIDPFMNTDDKVIQEQLTQTLYQVHPNTKNPEEFLSHLLQVASDKDSSIQKIHAATISLGKIARYGSDDVKKRVKKVLKTLCMQTRDPIICNEFSALE